MTMLQSPAFRARRFNLLHQPAPGCVIWHPGQDDAYSATIRDRSGNNNHGTIYGATWTKLPSGLWALNFDGTDDYVNTGNATSLQITGALTITAWVKPKTIVGNDCIVNKSDPAGGQRGYNLYIATGIPTFVISSTIDPHAGGIRAATTTLTAGNWYFIAGVFYPDTNQDIYLNGNLDNGDLTGAIPASIANPARNLIIGAGYNNSDIPNADYFDGIIGEARIYNRALLAGEIAQHFAYVRHLFGV